MKTNKIVIVFYIVSISYGLSAQSFLNNGQTIQINPGAELYINGSLTNNYGEIIIDREGQTNAELTVIESITNNSTIKINGSVFLNGNWYNNGILINDEGTLYLTGQNQDIGGNNHNTFSNLVLSEPGIKLIENHLHILNSVDLGDSELAASNYGIHISNQAANSISFNNGFVSTEQFGYLSLNMLSTQEYCFPLGYNFQSPILRPLKITMPIAELSMFRCSFIHKNPDEHGLYTSLIGDSIEYLNDLYYHKISRVEGISDVQIDFIFDESDGNFDKIAFWQNTSPPLWQLLYNSTLESPSQIRLNFSNDSERINFVLCKKQISNDTLPEEPILPDEVIIYNSFSPNGDSFNDSWIIENCETCSVQVFNRNGNLVFISEDNSIDWDGKFNNQDVPDATYYYIIETADKTKTYKGSITILR